MWSLAEAIDETTLVSLIGEQWSPKTPPPSTALTTSGSDTTTDSLLNKDTRGTASVIMIAKVPQLVPVEKAMNALTKNTSGATSTGVRNGLTLAATQGPVPSA